jgi:5-methyltetrahydrofolate--homocysteine methyltransferase
MADLKAMAAAVEQGDREAVLRLVQAALAQGTSAEQILNQGLIAAMTTVGERFTRSEIFIPEVLIAARAMTAAMKILEPILVQTGIQPRGKVVIGTVKSDLHDIGKNLVAMMLKGSGFQVTDLGVDVSPERFVTAAREQGAQIVAVSSLLTTTMLNMRDVVKQVRAAGLPAKVIVGGAPVTEAFAKEIGADGYSPDAGSAVRLALELVTAKA